jgi:hypothetical protein
MKPVTEYGIYIGLALLVRGALFKLSLIVFLAAIILMLAGADSRQPIRLEAKMYLIHGSTMTQAVIQQLACVISITWPKLIIIAVLKTLIMNVIVAQIGVA